MGDHAGILGAVVFFFLSFSLYRLLFTQPPQTSLILILSPARSVLTGNSPTGYGPRSLLHLRLSMPLRGCDDASRLYSREKTVAVFIFFFEASPLAPDWVLGRHDDVLVRTKLTRYSVIGKIHSRRTWLRALSTSLRIKYRTQNTNMGTYDRSAARISPTTSSQKGKWALNSLW